jgi:hypothetical protein
MSSPLRPDAVQLRRDDHVVLEAVQEKRGSLAAGG